MAKLRSFRNNLVVVPVQIVCGDCDTLEANPRATFLVERNGQTVCESCGGRAYVLKSRLDLARERAITQAIAAVEFAK